MSAVAAVVWSRPIGAASEVSLLDVIELDMGYTTIVDQYYRPVEPQTILDGARVGIVAYLRSRGVDDPRVPLLHARSDGRGVVPAIEQQIGRTIERYGPRVDPRDLVYGALRGELAALHDPYSVFFTKRELTGFTTALDGKSFAGIGVVVAQAADGAFVADEVFDGGPAARAGLMAGDRIVAIDGKSVAGATPQTLGALLRGASGTVVRVDAARSGSDALLHLSVTRAPVTPPDVRAALLPGDIAYVALRTFGPNAGPQVRAALVRLRAQGARATIFDLRGNGGGYESSAVQVASVFVAHGAIVSTQANRGACRTTPAAGDALPPQALAVLVDHDSASGSELVTAAIADHRLGTVLGNRTFGKGLVQTMFPLPDGSAMKVTTARYFTPAGRDIDRVGIAPDVSVDEPAGAQIGVPGRDPQLDAALTLLAQPAITPTAAPATNR